MKNLFVIIGALTLITNCKKEENIEHASCNNLTTENSWSIINFKTDYSIQVPDGFKGPGMVGFEGNNFFKYSSDTSIIFEYGYCNGLFCFDFGDTLKSPIPNSIKVKDNAGNLITLNNIQKFCLNSETVGVLYYLDDLVSDNPLYWNSRLYWKDNGQFKQAMQIRFQSSGLKTVNEIIQTIKSK